LLLVAVAPPLSGECATGVAGKMGDGGGAAAGAWDCRALLDACGDESVAAPTGVPGMDDNAVVDASMLRLEASETGGTKPGEPSTDPGELRARAAVSSGEEALMISSVVRPAVSNGGRGNASRRADSSI
jgi:hypothetical protein